MLKRIALSTLILFNFFTVFSQLKDWKLERNESGIAIYSKKNSERGIKELKIITNIKCSLTKITGILHDLANANKYMDSYKISKTITHENNNNRWDYIEIKMPWPLSNRDIVVHHWHAFDPIAKTYTSRMKSNPAYIAQKPGIVRLKHMQGSWVIKSLAENSVSAEYNILLDPGENIPAWLINVFVVDVPFKTIIKLKALAES